MYYTIEQLFLKFQNVLYKNEKIDGIQYEINFIVSKNYQKYVKESKFLTFHVGLEFSDHITSFKF